MAVKQPAPRVRRRPLHQHRGASRDVLRDDGLLLVGCVLRVLVDVSKAQYFVEGPVKMHGVIDEARVDDAPPNHVPHRVHQRLGVWVALSIDRHDIEEPVQDVGVSLHAVDHENAIREHGTGRIDDERAVQLCVGFEWQGEWLVSDEAILPIWRDRARPIEIRPRRPCGKRQLPRLAGRDLHSGSLLAGRVRKPYTVAGAFSVFVIVT